MRNKKQPRSVKKNILPQPETNNIWWTYKNSGTAIVFVHGILSDSRRCWLHEDKTIPNKHKLSYWPQLVRDDPRFKNASIYLAGYYTAIDSGPYELSDCAQEMIDAFKRPDSKYGQALLNKDKIIFVCHSMGGVVTRYLLESNQNDFKNKKVGLILIASPSYGAKLADRLALLTKYFNHSQGTQLKWGSWSLKDLDDRFKEMIARAGIPKLSGIEAVENHFVFNRRFLWDKKVIVSKESAGRYFGRVRMLRDTDHFNCVKPHGLNHPAYELLVDFFLEFSGAIDSTEIQDPQDPGLPKRARQRGPAAKSKERFRGSATKKASGKPEGKVVIKQDINLPGSPEETEQNKATLEAGNSFPASAGLDSDRITYLNQSTPKEKEVIKQQAINLTQAEIEHLRMQRLPSSVLFIDIDDMTKINKRYGEDIGNKTIGIVQEILGNQQKRISESFIFTRFGEDEFICNSAVTQNYAARLANKIREEIALYPWHSIVLGLRVTVSIGVAQYSSNDTAFKCIVRAIQGSMQAKQSGGNRVKRAPTIIPAEYSHDPHDYGS